MTSADARPIPLKNTAYRLTACIYDQEGDLVSAAAGLDSEVSIDGGAFADCTAEATEIGSSGFYTLDLTAAEMNGDTIAVQIKTTTVGAKTTALVMYPAENTDIPVNVTAISGAAVSTSTAQLGVNVVQAAGTAWGSGAITSGALATTAVDEIVDGVWDEVLTGATHNVVNSAGRRLRTLQDVGNYTFGAVWINTDSANTGSTFPDDGTFLNPVQSLANALTVANAATQVIKRFFLQDSSSITLASAFSGYHFDGDSYILALGGQDVSDTTFENFDTISGICTGTLPHFSHGAFGSVTLPPCTARYVGFASTVTIGSAGNYFFIDCFSEVAGSATPTIDMGAGVGATNMSIRRWSGGLTFQNIQAGDVISVDAISGGTITVNGTGGSINIRGMVRVVDNSGGLVTITQTQAINSENINAQADLALSDVGLTTTVTGRIDAAISSRLASASYTAPDNAGIDAIETALAANLDVAVSTRATPAQVNAEVVDALVTDTYAEPSAVPAATASLKDKLGWLMALARNRRTVTSTTHTLRNDANSGNIATAPVSDDGATFVQGEWV